MTLKEEVLQLRQEMRMLQEQLAQRDNQIAQMQREIGQFSEQLAQRAARIVQMQQQIDALITRSNRSNLSPRHPALWLYFIATISIGLVFGIVLNALGRLPTVVVNIGGSLGAVILILSGVLAALLADHFPSPRAIWQNAHRRVASSVASILTVILFTLPALIVSSLPQCVSLGMCSPESTATIARLTATAQATANAKATATANAFATIAATPCFAQAGTPTVTPPIVGALPIYVGKFAAKYMLSAGIIDANNTPITWVGVTDASGELRMPYPTGEKSGLVSITVGPPNAQPRPGEDFSRYQRRSLELCGQKGGEAVMLGLKDNKGGENRVSVTGLTTSWEPKSYLLSSFAGVDLHNLYVVTEFIFEGMTEETVYVRNIQYLP